MTLTSKVADLLQSLVTRGLFLAAEGPVTETPHETSPGVWLSDDRPGTRSAASASRRKKICMLSHNNYETDNRVRRYAEALAKRGDHVDVIALSGGQVPLGMETINGVNVFRVQHRNRDERHKWTHAWRTMRFLLVSSTVLTRLHFRVRYDVIHVHNLPDFLVFAAWYPKLTGTKLILDIHDLMPELFASK